LPDGISVRFAFLMKQFFFGIALLGFVLSLFALAWQYESNNKLKGELLSLKEQNSKILDQQLRQRQLSDREYAEQLGTLKNTVNALGQSVSQNQSKVSLIELEKAYKSGEKSFLQSCNGMKGISSREFFEKAYFDELSKDLKSTHAELQNEEKTSLGVVFPWERANAFTVFALCEDGSDVYVFTGYSENIHSTFLGVGRFSQKTKDFSFVSSPNTFLFLKEIVKEKDVIRFVAQDICSAGEDAYIACDDPNAVQPVQRLTQSQVNYNLVDNTFAVVNP
jgi:hypothetical protein